MGSRKGNATDDIRENNVGNIEEYIANRKAYRAFIGLGSNLESMVGDAAQTIEAAAQRIGMLEDVCFVRLSSLYTSEPAFFKDQPLFTNAVLEVQTSRTASELLEALQTVEQELGRKRSIQNGPRTLDCDLLDYEGVVCFTPALTLPHPGILERDFVVTPLLEIAPDHILANGNPVTRENIACGAVIDTSAHTPPHSAVFSVCATPIGNLGDVTLRVLDTLKDAKVIFAEDTRVTRKLLTRYDIHTYVERCDENVLARKLPQLIKRLEAGERVAFVTDAGMPGISDPGSVLVGTVRAAGYKVEVLPGASAAITALVASGFSVQSFYFGGFLPRSEMARKTRLEEMNVLTDTALVFYESPHRVVATLKAFAQVFPTREVCIARELTKLYEETLFGTPNDLLVVLEERLSTRGAIKGEIVLVVSPSVHAHSHYLASNQTQDQEQEISPFASFEDPIVFQIQEDIQVRAAELAAQKTLRRSQIAKTLVKEFGITREQAYEAAAASFQE